MIFLYRTEKQHKEKQWIKHLKETGIRLKQAAARSFKLVTRPLETGTIMESSFETNHRGYKSTKTTIIIKESSTTQHIL